MNYYSFHIGDYLSATVHLSLLEHGAYRRLLDVYYINEAPLHPDVIKVYRLAGARTQEEKDAVDCILAEFFTLTDAGYTHSRCDHQIALCNKNRGNGSKGGRPSKKESNPNDNPSNNPTGTQTEPKPEPNRNRTGTEAESPPLPHYPITQKNKSNAAKAARFDPKEVQLPYAIPADSWKAWIDYRRERKLTCAEATIRAQVAKLESWAASGHTPAQIIAESITNGWQGLFEPKQMGKQEAKSPAALRDFTGIGSAPAAPLNREAAARALAEIEARRRAKA